MAAASNALRSRLSFASASNRVRGWVHRHLRIPWRHCRTSAAAGTAWCSRSAWTLITPDAIGISQPSKPNSANWTQYRMWFSSAFRCDRWQLHYSLWFRSCGFLQLTSTHSRALLDEAAEQIRAVPHSSAGGEPFRFLQRADREVDYGAQLAQLQVFRSFHTHIIVPHNRIEAAGVKIPLA